MSSDQNRTINLPRLDDAAGDAADDAAADPARVSRFDVERLACAELQGAEKARVEAALASDPALQAFFDDVVASDRAFLIAQPPAAFFEKQRAKQQATQPTQQQGSWLKRLERFVMRWEAGVGVLAAATAIVIVINVGAPRVDGLDGERSRSKGGDAPSVGFFVMEDAGAAPAARVGRPGQALRAGDRIQLAVKDVDKKAMVVVGIDGKGAVSVYAKEQITSTNKGPNNSKPRLLPTSLVLDDTVGTERFFVVYGDNLAELEGVVTEAAEHMARNVKNGTIDLAAGERLSIHTPGIVQASVHIQKVR